MGKKEMKKERQSRAKTIHEIVYSLRGFHVETVQYFINGSVFTLMTPVATTLDPMVE
jgi:hypothetical protein